MAFTNDAEYKDDFRQIGADATAEFEQTGSLSNPTEHAGSENLEIAAKADDLDEEEDAEDDDLEDDEDDDLEEDDEEEEDLDEEDDEDVDEADEEDDDDEEEDDDDDEDDEEGTDAAVMARLAEAEKTARTR